MHNARTITLYFHAYFCEHNAHTIFPASVGFTQDCSKNNFQVKSYSSVTNLMSLGNVDITALKIPVEVYIPTVSGTVVVE